MSWGFGPTTFPARTPQLAALAPLLDRRLSWPTPVCVSPPLDTVLMRQSAGRACCVSRCRCEQPWLASTAVSVTPAGSDEGHRAEVNEKKQPMEDSFSGERVDAQVHNHPLEADVATVSQHMLATCNLVHRSKMAWREKPRHGCESHREKREAATTITKKTRPKAPWA